MSIAVAELDVRFLAPKRRFRHPSSLNRSFRFPPCPDRARTARRAPAGPARPLFARAVHLAGAGSGERDRTGKGGRGRRRCRASNVGRADRGAERANGREPVEVQSSPAMSAAGETVRFCGTDDPARTPAREVSAKGPRSFETREPRLVRSSIVLSRPSLRRTVSCTCHWHLGNRCRRFCITLAAARHADDASAPLRGPATGHIARTQRSSLSDATRRSRPSLDRSAVVPPPKLGRRPRGSPSTLAVRLVSAPPRPRTWRSIRSTNAIASTRPKPNASSAVCADRSGVPAHRSRGAAGDRAGGGEGNARGLARAACGLPGR